MTHYLRFALIDSLCYPCLVSVKVVQVQAAIFGVHFHWNCSGEGDK